MRLLHSIDALRLGTLALALVAALPAQAGQFGVSPIRLDLDRNAKSGAITVSNDEQAESLRVQLRLFEWSQDVDGKDQYQESQDLLYFPRLMEVEKGQQRLVRVGMRLPASAKEKTYRLFVEELPSAPLAGAPASTRVAIAVRFGVPVFVKPAEEAPSGEIEKLEISKGVLRVVVRNTGNVHFTIGAIKATGTGVSKQAPGWYLLAGVSREHLIALPAQDCTRLKRLDVVVETDRLELRGALDVDASMCKP